MRAIIPFLLVPLLISLSSAVAQTPVVVQAAAPVAAPATQAAAGAPASSSAAAVQLLQAMKAANEETLKKQTATLQQLDELEKAAAQIRILGKRS